MRFRIPHLISVMRCYHSSCTSVFIGLSVGIALSMVITPLINEDCRRVSEARYSGGRSLQSDTSPSDTEAEDYEPKLTADAKPLSANQKAEAEKPALIRPRFYSTELGIKEKLFVGILSDKDTIGTLAVAVNQTLAHHVDKLVFFVSAPGVNEKSSSTWPPFVRLQQGPKFLKMASAIAYIGEHFIGEYDYFFLARDSVYIRGMKLKLLAGGISVSTSIYMGRVLENAKNGSPYCDFQAGVLLSQRVLKSVIQNLNWCIGNALPNDESSNFGKCIAHSAGLGCNSIIQGNAFGVFDLGASFQFDRDISTFSQSNEFNSAITFYPVSDQDTIYKLHLYFTRIELKETEREIANLETGIKTINQLLPPEMQSNSWPLGVPPPSKPKDRFSVLQWDYLTESYVYPNTEFGTVRNLTTTEREDLKEIVAASVTHLQNSAHQLQYQGLINCYRRFDPGRGMEYVVDLAIKDRNSGEEMARRLELIRPLGKVELVPMPYVTENTRLVMVLPVTATDDTSRTIQFLKDFADVCLAKQDNVILVLILISSKPTGQSGRKTTSRGGDHFDVLKSLVNSYNNKYQTEGAKVSWMGLRTSATQPAAFGVLDLISKKFPSDTLYVMCQPGMEIRTEFLNRARMNTIQGWQVFFPIPFVQYHPDIIYDEKEIPNTIEIGKNYGHFDTHAFDYFSFYNSDYRAGRKLVENEVPVAKNERDMKDERHHAKNGHNIFEMFLKMKSVHVMRAVEPSLRVRYETKVCGRALNPNTYQHCEASFLEGFASRSQLANLLFQYEKNGG